MATAVDLLEYAIRSQLKWKRDGTDWVLWYGRHRVGHLVPDAKHPGMFRWATSSGRLSDMANISWVKYAVMGAAIRDPEWETRAVQIVKSEAGPETVSREITCRSFGGPLPGRVKASLSAEGRAYPKMETGLSEMAYRSSEVSRVILSVVLADVALDS
jgi:hypothetical protein